MDNYKAVNEEIAKLLVELKNYNPMEDEYRTIANRIEDLEKIRRSMKRDFDHEKQRKATARKDTAELCIMGAKVILGVGVILAGFCFEEHDSLTGVFKKAIIPKLDFFK